MKKLWQEEDILRLAKEGKHSVEIGKGDIITPLALDRIKTLGIKIIDSSFTKDESNVSSGVIKKIAIGSDHTGFELKKILTGILKEKSYFIIDVGTFNNESCDFPDFAHEVAQKVYLKEADRGIIIDATGIPSAITANKMPGIRAATCYNEFSARSSREHNDSNILVVGAKALGEETVKSILEVWFNTDFAGGRHQKRLDKIKNIEERYLQKR